MVGVVLVWCLCVSCISFSAHLFKEGEISKPLQRRAAANLERVGYFGLWQALLNLAVLIMNLPVVANSYPDSLTAEQIWVRLDRSGVSRTRARSPAPLFEACGEVSRSLCQSRCGVADNFAHLHALPPEPDYARQPNLCFWMLTREKYLVSVASEMAQIPRSGTKELNLVI